mmetsp:Transcript_20611/g.64853  ORF Transcript_20611/g.64853 Transcript_20611/m.64853 type:complete len:232 (-) Transcript_20611:92-787(-)
MVVRDDGERRAGRARRDRHGPADATAFGQTRPGVALRYLRRRRRRRLRRRPRLRRPFAARSQGGGRSVDPVRGPAGQAGVDRARPGQRVDRIRPGDRRRQDPRGNQPLGRPASRCSGQEHPRRTQRRWSSTFGYRAGQDGARARLRDVRPELRVVRRRGRADFNTGRRGGDDDSPRVARDARHASRHRRPDRLAALDEARRPVGAAPGDALGGESQNSPRDRVPEVRSSLF